MIPNISFCVYGKNRLFHCKRSLPHLYKLIQDTQDEIIYVDYSCEQNSGIWTNAFLPNIKTIRVKNCTWWHINHARNIAAKSANNDILVFMDIDNIIDPKIIPIIKQLVNDDKYLIIHLAYPNVSGFCAVTKNNFFKVNGYEESFVGYGWDETFFYESLDILGIKKIETKKYYPKFIKEPNEERIIENKDDLNLSSYINMHIATYLRLYHPYKSNINRNWGIYDLNE